jgi:hypothetical protein
LRFLRKGLERFGVEHFVALLTPAFNGVVGFFDGVVGVLHGVVGVLEGVAFEFRF